MPDNTPFGYTEQEDTKDCLIFHELSDLHLEVERPYIETVKEDSE